MARLINRKTVYAAHEHVERCKCRIQEKFHHYSGVVISDVVTSVFFRTSGISGGAENGAISTDSNSLPTTTETVNLNQLTPSK